MHSGVLANTTEPLKHRHTQLTCNTHVAVVAGGCGCKVFKVVGGYQNMFYFHTALLDTSTGGGGEYHVQYKGYI